MEAAIFESCPQSVPVESFGVSEQAVRCRLIQAIHPDPSIVAPSPMNVQHWQSPLYTMRLQPIHAVVGDLRTLQIQRL